MIQQQESQKTLAENVKSDVKMKSQGLPLTTIVVTILVIIVLAALGFSFFKGFGQGKEGVSVAECQQYCSQLHATRAASPDMTLSELMKTKEGQLFCDNCITDDGKSIISCKETDEKTGESVEVYTNCIND